MVELYPYSHAKPQSYVNGELNLPSQHSIPVSFCHCGLGRWWGDLELVGQGVK